MGKRCYKICYNHYKIMVGMYLLIDNIYIKNAVFKRGEEFCFSIDLLYLYAY
ncbi:hypothetical protein ND00_01350 [Clostridium sp. L74]|nr:hypothetical protein ND00_01350 [Clostridium sp. L74]